MKNQFRDNIVGMAEDEMMTCVSCGNRWYAKWYKDGFCDTCQKNGTYASHKEYLRGQRIMTFAIKSILVIASLIGLALILHLA